MNIRIALFPPINEMVFIAVYFTRTRQERISLFNNLLVSVPGGDEISRMHKFEVIKAVHDKNPFICRWMQAYMRNEGCWDADYICAYRWVLRGVPPLYAAKKLITQRRVGIEIYHWKQAQKTKRVYR